MALRKPFGILGLFLLALSVSHPASLRSKVPAAPAGRVPTEATVTRRISSPEAVRRATAPAFPSLTSNHEEVMVDLTRSSSGSWQVIRGPRFVTRLYGARLALRGSPVEAGDEFFARFGDLIGVSPANIRLESIRNIEGNTQLIYAQELDGLPVFGSRINMVLDADKNLIYLSSSVYDGASSRRQAVPARVAAQVASMAIGEYARRHLLPEPAVSPGELQSSGRLGYRLTGSAIGLVYEFRVASRIPLLDLRIYVDGGSGDLAGIENQLKNK